MTQTPAKRITSRGDAIDYTPTSNVAAGDVVEIGSIPLVATSAIVANTLGSVASEGVFDVPKTSDAFVVGDAVYWNSSATDVGSNTGAADNASGNLMGLCVTNAATTAAVVRTKLTAAKRTTTIGGAVTASGITGEDNSLGITGLASVSGAVVIAGGAGNGAAGGLVSVTGGLGPATYAGGAASLIGGAGGTTADGGAVAITGGASGNGASANGGAVAITGGAAVGTAGDGGAITITGGAGSTAGTQVGGALTLLSGAGDASNGTAGAVILDSSGTGATKGAITIGTNAASLTLAKMPRVPFAVLAANGSDGASAGVLVAGWTKVTGADNAKGVILPACVGGAQCIVINQETDKTLKVYPPSGKQINGAGADNSIVMAANTMDIFASEGANAWYGCTTSLDLS